MVPLPRCLQGEPPSGRHGQMADAGHVMRTQTWTCSVLPLGGRHLPPPARLPHTQVWARGRVGLLGDAAHLATQFLAQASCVFSARLQGWIRELLRNRT